MLQESFCRDLGLSSDCTWYSRQFVIGTRTNFLAPKLSLSQKYKVRLLCYVVLLVSVFFQQSPFKTTKPCCDAPHVVACISGNTKYEFVFQPLRCSSILSDRWRTWLRPRKSSQIWAQFSGSSSVLRTDVNITARLGPFFEDNKLIDCISTCEGRGALNLNG